MNKVFPCSLKKNKILFLFKKTKKRLFFQKKKQKTQVGWVFLKNPGFLKPDLNTRFLRNFENKFPVFFKTISRHFPDFFQT